jgi:LAS superfamily LD-carboxypeptidase LdcB
VAGFLLLNSGVEMKKQISLLLALTILLSHKAQAGTDFQCVSNCQARGYLYQLCMQQCSYSDQQQPQVNLNALNPNGGSIAPLTYNPSPQVTQLGDMIRQQQANQAALQAQQAQAQILMQQAGQPPIWSPGSIGTFVPDGRAVATGAIA